MSCCGGHDHKGNHKRVHNGNHPTTDQHDREGHGCHNQNQSIISPWLLGALVVVGGTLIWRLF